MPNMIEKIKGYSKMLDEVYALASITSVLDSSPSLFKESANKNELLVPKMSFDGGLSDYSRADGYTAGSVTLEFESKKFDYERGKKFAVDILDNEESGEIISATLLTEFVKTKVAPEIDAVRIAKYSSKAIAAGKYASANLTTAADVIAALRAAITGMTNSEVSGDKILYIRPELLALIKDSDLTKSKDVLSNFVQIIEAPISRMYTKVTLGNGYTKAADGFDLNFFIATLGANIQISKHSEITIVPHTVNQDSDLDTMKYRFLGMHDIYDNKVAGLYAHYAPAE